MSPDLVRELDAEAAAIVRAIDDIPRGQQHDMVGHLDAKKAAMRRVERLAKRWREGAAGVAPKTVPERVSGPMKSAHQRAPRALLIGAR